MRRLVPESLFGQTLVILLAGLIVSHAVGSWLYTADREQAVRTVGGFAAAQRIANLTRLVQDAPIEWRARIVTALSDPAIRVTLANERPAAPAPTDGNGAAQAIKAYLVGQIPPVAGREPLVVVLGADRPPFAGFHPRMGPGPMMHGLGGFRDLFVAIPLADGPWLTFQTGLPDTGPAFSRQFLVSMAVMALIILAISVFVVRRVTAPLSSLAAAADRLGRDVNAAPLPETGSIEMRKAARAFNDMQVRLRNLIENRTRLLAAISHDLRTPLTLLRLRAETVENAQEREKIIATIGEMDSLIATTLAFARDEALAEPRRPTDLAALLQSLADDLRDAGRPVTMVPAAAPVIHECRPLAMKRALSNLIDNAVKYGKSATVAIQTKPDSIAITIDDEGPGIPDAELARVLEPFYRLERSRSRETGGVGLGLAIALSIVQSHGGSLALANRPGGGLRATVSLPR